MKGKIKKKTGFFTFNALPFICFEKPNYFILITVWKPFGKSTRIRMVTRAAQTLLSMVDLCKKVIFQMQSLFLRQDFHNNSNFMLLSIHWSFRAAPHHASLHVCTVPHTTQLSVIVKKILKPQLLK